jgi:hypothetical protein
MFVQKVGAANRTAQDTPENGSPGSIPPATVVRRMLVERMPCVCSYVVDCVSQNVGSRFAKVYTKIASGQMSLPTYRVPAPLRIRERGVHVTGNGHEVYIEIPWRTNRLCTLATDRKLPCAETASEKPVGWIQLRCIADGRSAIATARKIINGKDGFEHRDLALVFQRGKLMAKLTYRCPLPAKVEGGQAAALVMSLRNALYAVAEDGRSWSAPAEPLIARRRRFSKEDARRKQALVYASKGARGHGRRRLFRALAGRRDREARWADAINWRLANEFAAWCARVGVTRVYASSWAENDKQGKPSDVSRAAWALIHRWPREALLGRCGEVLNRQGRIVEKMESEKECRCPICAKAPLLPWNESGVARCPECGYVRDRDYIRCVWVLDKAGIDVKPVVRETEAEFRRMKNQLQEIAGTG